MKFSVRYVLFVLTVVLVSSVHAQVADTAKKWNIQDCFQYAIRHNIQITTLRLDEQLYQQDLSAAKGQKIPTLSGSASNTFNNSNNDVAGNGQFVNQLNSSGSYSANSFIVLWNGNYINNNIRQNNLLLQSAGLSVQQSVNNITLLITQGYLNILLSKETLKYITDLVSTSAALVKQGQLFYDAGSIAKNSLLQLQAQSASDKYLLVQTQNSIRQNILSLKQLLQLPSDSSFDIVTPSSIEVAVNIPLLHNVLQRAFQLFPEIEIGKLGIDIASLDIAKARAGFKPVLTANASIGTGYNEIITNSTFSKTGYFTQTGNNFYQQLGVTLSVPVFSNRIHTTNLEKAKIGYKQAGLNSQNNQLVLSQAVEQAYLNISNAKEAYDAANEQLLAATETYRIVNEQFKLGGINSFDLLQQRNQYVQAVQAYTQAKYTAVLQQKIYEFYRGTPVTF